MRILIKNVYSRPLTFKDGYHDQNVNIIWNGQLKCDDPVPQAPGTLGARQDEDGGGGACPLPGNGGNNGLPSVPAVTYQPGPPGPLCTANCGKLCSGFYCVPTPTGTPPDFTQGPSLTNLPTLPPTTTSCASGSAAGTSTQCAGNNGHSACVTRQVCTKTSDPAPPPSDPTTPPRDPGMYCYREHNEGGQWKSFKDTDAQGTYKTVCESDLELATNGQGFLGGTDGMYFALRWAADQSGCKEKKAFTLKDNCYTPMGQIGSQCDLVGQAENENYGGVYRQNGEYGCVEFIIRKE